MAAAPADRKPDGVVRERILIVDYGSQFTQLIARRIREAAVFCEVRPPEAAAAELAAAAPKGVVLSGGPASVYEEGAPRLDPVFVERDVPVLGICYGMQLLALDAGGAVRPGKREYGRAALRVRDPEDALFRGFAPGEDLQVWCSHGDHVDEPPLGFRTLASTPDLPVAAFRRADRPVYGVQFHPEVAHTPRGAELLRNFLFRVCGCAGDWTPVAFASEAVERVRAAVGGEAVVAGLSGGVDSAVAAALVHRAVGDALTCVFVDTGLLRKGERELVERAFKDACLVVVDARAEFLEALKGVSDPERKRRAIGEQFVRVFERAARDSGGGARFLVQGTLYPDVIESTSSGGPSAVIKTHHNVGGLPGDMDFELVEPLRDLFKDEVRRVGRELGLAEEVLGRHPFPGPGLAIRVLGPVSEARLAVLREADAIFLEEIEAAGLYDEIWQAFAVLLPVRSVGVMGDARTYEHVAVLRAVTSTDGMTADWHAFDPAFLRRVSARIVNEVAGVNRVAYDVSSKPPATIEWE